MKLILNTLKLLLIAVLLLTALPVISFGEADIDESPDVRFFINGNSIALTDVPIVSDNRTLLPLREILISLGVPNDDQHIIWNESKKSVTFKTANTPDGTNTTVILKVGSTSATINGAPSTMEVPPLIYKDKVYIPVRFVSEALGYKVVWEENLKSVFVTKDTESVLRRKGEFDKKAAIPVKRALLVGVNTNSLIDTSTNPAITYNYFFELNDMLSRGIPFHLATYTSFVNSYNSSDWLDKYDVIVFYGKYLPEDTVCPAQVKNAVVDIIKNNKYKIIQMGSFGMEREGIDSDYWYSDLGIAVDSIGKAKSNNFTAPVTVTGNSIMAEAGATHQCIGVCDNAYGKGLVCLSNVQNYTDTWFASAESNKKWAFVSNDNPQYNTNFVDRYNTAIDFGKLIWYLRGMTSHIAFNRINSNKYIAYGIDCDRTTCTQSIDYLRQIIGDRPLELGLVASKLNAGLASYYKNLQNNGVSIVSHTLTHPTNTLSTDEFTKSIDILNGYGFKSDNIVYTTALLNDYTQLKPVKDMGYLMCGHLQSYGGRNCVQVPLGSFDILKSSTQIGGSPIITMSCADDIFTMSSFGENASQRFKDVFQIANSDTYGVPLIFYFHDSMLDISFDKIMYNLDGTETDNSLYYKSQEGIDRRMQYYKDAFSYMDTFKYNYIKRSEAIQLITDINDCVSVTGEKNIFNGITTSIAATRQIKGLTVAVPVNPGKTIASVKLGTSTLGSDKYQLSDNKSWLYVSVDTEAGKEYFITATYR